METEPRQDDAAVRTAAEATAHEFSSNGPAAVAVVDAVSAVSGTDPIDLPPLYETIDPDAVNALLEASDPDSPVRIEFSYAGYDVVLRDGPRVTVRTDDLDPEPEDDG
ncbi:HalOD1 output domain-containing protein [Halopiger goleimassiliensis]|uniref:HalOD1 output domain-containing protein n=1 Tax=Halopiger goleimassiliensis TaxID=1293048 RepID=UPI0006782A64|nr:HalOD1 output domain-containing protein [Halopiger goleimassiliensis]